MVIGFRISNKIGIWLFALLFSNACMAFGFNLSHSYSSIVVRVGILKVVGAVATHTGAFETGGTIESKRSILIKETTDIPYKPETFFGVSFNNIRKHVKVRFVWRYPSIKKRFGRNGFSTYESPEYDAFKQHQIYWKIDKGERKGKYQLDVYFDGHLYKKTVFHVR